MQPKREPVIFAGDMSNEELYSWLRGKADAAMQLRGLRHEKASLERRLSEVDSLIDEVTFQSQLEIYQRVPDPTLLQGDQALIETTADLIKKGEKIAAAVLKNLTNREDGQA